MKAKDLAPGSLVPLLSGPGQFGVDSFPDLAELAGNLLGDGYLGSSTAYWGFFGDDIEYGKYLLELARPYATGRLATELTVKPPDSLYGVPRAGFNSPRLRNLLVSSLGVSKSPIRVPNRVWGADKVTVAGFLRGLYAADGHSEDGTSVVLAQVDREFLQEIQLLLANFGIRARIFKHGVGGKKIIYGVYGDPRQIMQGPCWRLVVGGWDQVNQFSREIGMGVPAKQERLEERLESKKDRKRSSAWRTSVVAAVEHIGFHQTYCLTEPMTNTVTANGVVVGQCRHTLVRVPPGYGFKAGAVAYVGRDHDELARQRG